MAARRLSCMFVLILGVCWIYPLSGQTSPSAAKTRTGKSKKAPPPRMSAQDRIQLPSGESMSVADIVPRSEEAVRKLQAMTTAVKPSEVDAAKNSLAALNKSVAETRPETENTIKLARSTMQISELKLQWNRERAQLETLKSSITRYSATLEQVQKELIVIRDTWAFLASPEMTAKLPPELSQRAVVVLQVARDVEKGVAAEADQLLSLQVLLAETGTKIGDTIEQLDSAQAALRDQFFVLDSAPLFSALKNADYHLTFGQIGTLSAGSKFRTLRFFDNYRSNVLVYLVFSIGVLLVVVQLSKVKVPVPTAKWDPRILNVLRHPVMISLLLCVGFFPFLFTNAPPEVLRISRLLTVFPVVHLALAIVGPVLRRPIIFLGTAYAVDVVSVQITSGTLIRRIIALVLAICITAALVRLLRRGTSSRNRIEEGGAVLPILLGISALLLGISIVCNILGNVSLADLLITGTIIGIYYGLALYVMASALTAVAAAFVASSVGQRSRALRLHGELVDRKIYSFAANAARLIWIFVLLFSFQISKQTFSSISSVLHRKLEMGTVSLSLLDVVLFCLVLLVSSLIAKLIRFLLNEEILPRTSINAGAGQAGTRLMYIALLTLGFFLALGAAGLELSKLTVLTGAFGVGLGFGLQNVVSNFVSGIILSLERPVQLGDLVEIDQVVGQVTTIGFRSSTIRTFEGADVIVPNSELITKSVINWSLTDYLRRTEIQIGVAYGTHPQKVIAILANIVNSHPQVVRQPEPLITFDAFGDSSLNFTVRFWSRLDQRLQIRSELNMQIAAELENNNISIPFPQRDVHLFMDQSSAKLNPAEPEGARAASAGANG